MAKDVTIFVCRWGITSRKSMPKNGFKTLKEARAYAYGRLPRWGDMDSIHIYKEVWGPSKDFPLKGYAIQKKDVRVVHVFRCGENGKPSTSSEVGKSWENPNYYLNKDGSLGAKWKTRTA